MPHPEILESAEPSALAPFDDIIDVRSPAEFEEDHVPGAINLPVLDNIERGVVGTIYVQESAFRARRVGAALVAKNIARHLETRLADRPSTWRPLVYCWRGGQRSNAMATVLGQVGWRTFVLEGGYKTYRRRVQARLYDQALGLDLILLDGGTGVGKTQMLSVLSKAGVQTLDLEGLAEHRGSLFGGLAARQPAQKLFESRISSALEGLDSSRPVVVEAEAHKIGDRMLPPSIWRAMAEAPRLVLKAPRSQRARYLVSAYGALMADREALKAIFARLPVHISREQVLGFRRLVDEGAFIELAEALMQIHYDPAYDRAAKGRAALAEIVLDRLDDETMEQAGQSIVRRLSEA